MSDRAFTEPRSAAPTRDAGGRVVDSLARRGDHRREPSNRDVRFERGYARHERIEDGLVPDLRLPRFAIAGTACRAIVTTSSALTHAHMERSTNGTWVSDYICGQGCQSQNQFAYSTWMIRMLHMTIERPE